MQKNNIARLAAKCHGHAAAFIEDSAHTGYAVLTLLVPARPHAPAQIELGAPLSRFWIEAGAQAEQALD